MKGSLASAFVALLLLHVVLAAVFFAVGDGRPESVPAINDCSSDLDCPERMACYSNIVESYITGNSEDTDILDSACGCFHFFGEGGDAGLPSTPSDQYPSDGYCTESAGKPILVILAVITLLILTFTTVQLYRTTYQLMKCDAYKLNASGIVLFFCTASATFEVTLPIIYMLEIVGWVDPYYMLFDQVRPLMFGSFAVFQMGALLNVSIMWADVYEKSCKLGGRKSQTTPRLRKAVGILVFITFLVMFGALFTGYAVVTVAWITIVLLGTCLFYNRYGKQLGLLLMPADLTAPGAASSRLAGLEIIKTSKVICRVNLFYIFCLFAFAITNSRPSTGPLAFIFILLTFICSNIHQVRMMEYIRFGSRKKLFKGGYGKFRTSVLMSSSSVSPEMESEAKKSSLKSSGGASSVSKGSEA